MSEIKFEDAIKELEEIVGKLEEGNVSLDESIKLFERGMEIQKLCSQKLTAIEQKIEQIVKKNEGIETVPFEE